MALPATLLQQLLASEQLKLYSPKVSKALSNQQQGISPSPGTLKAPCSRTTDKLRKSPASATKQPQQGTGADLKLVRQQQQQQQLLATWGHKDNTITTSKVRQEASELGLQHEGSSCCPRAASAGSRRQSASAGALWSSLKGPVPSCSSSETKRKHNREKARDKLFAAVKQSSLAAGAVRHAWEQEQEQQLMEQGGDQQQGGVPGHGAPQQSVLQLLAKVLWELHLVMQDLLQQLHPGVLMYVCELYTSCVLQAANTGEHEREREHRERGGGEVNE
jgi:hypothetical protein